jgi:PAS domain-containing protein
LSEAKFRSLSESSPAGIFLADISGRRVYSNSKWLQMTGLTAGESMGEGWMRACIPEDKQGWSSCGSNACGSARNTPRNSAWSRRRGSPLGFLPRGADPPEAPAKDENGDPVESPDAGGYVGTMRDITEYKKVEEELREAKAGGGCRRQGQERIPGENEP